MEDPFDFRATDFGFARQRQHAEVIQQLSFTTSVRMNGNQKRTSDRQSQPFCIVIYFPGFVQHPVSLSGSSASAAPFASMPSFLAGRSRLQHMLADIGVSVIERLGTCRLNSSALRKPLRRMKANGLFTPGMWFILAAFRHLRRKTRW